MSSAKSEPTFRSRKKLVNSASKRWPSGYIVVANDAHSVILGVVKLALTPGSEESALRMRRLCRKLKHDANRLIFDLQRKSSARKKSRVYDRAANIGSDK